VEVKEMQLRMDLNGIVVRLRITGYKPCGHCDFAGEWCKVDYSFTAEPWLNYHREAVEVFSSSDIQCLADLIDKLLNDKLTEETCFDCDEPDFEFTLSPKFDARNNPNVLYVAPGHEILDIGMKWDVFFWNHGLTANHLSVYLNRVEIENLKNYLNLVMGEIEMHDPAIVSMIRNGVLGNAE